MSWRTALVEVISGDATNGQATIEQAQEAIWRLRQAALQEAPLTEVHASAALRSLTVEAPLLYRRRTRRIAARFTEAREQLLTDPAEATTAIRTLDTLRVELDAIADRTATGASLVRQVRRGSLLLAAVCSVSMAWWMRRPKPLQPMAVHVVADGLRLTPSAGGFEAPPVWNDIALRKAAEVYFGHTAPSDSGIVTLRLTAENPSYAAVADPGQVTVEAIRGDAEPFPFEVLPVDASILIGGSDAMPAVTLEGMGPLLGVVATVSHGSRFKSSETWATLPPRGHK
jgi:hypothetical protein